MPNHLTKSQIVAELVEAGVGDKRHVTNMLDGLAELAQDELAEGHDFVVPGIAKIEYVYKAAQKKGERYQVGDTVKGPQGERIADAPSPARRASIKMRAKPYGAVAKLRPGSKPEVQAEFVKSKLGKAIAKARS